MNLYEANKQIVSQLPEVNWDEELENYYNIIKDFVSTTNNSFYMLLCQEDRYYTLFQTGCEGKSIDIELIDIIRNYGAQVKSFTLTENKDAIEIWLNSKVAYFFPYDAGVIKCQ